MKFYVAKNKVICVIRYAGRNIRGIAKCSPQDKFDEEIGKKLAHLRCEEKLANAKYNYAVLEAERLDKELEELQTRCNKAWAREEELYSDVEEATWNLKNYIKSLD